MPSTDAPPEVRAALDHPEQAPSLGLVVAQVWTAAWRAGLDLGLTRAEATERANEDPEVLAILVRIRG